MYVKLMLSLIILLFCNKVNIIIVLLLISVLVHLLFKVKGSEPHYKFCLRSILGIPRGLYSVILLKLLVLYTPNPSVKKFKLFESVM